MPKSKNKIKYTNNPRYNKNATPKKLYWNTKVRNYIKRKITHTSPVLRTKENDGLHLKANKQYLKNEQRKERLNATV